MNQVNTFRYLLAFSLILIAGIALGQGFPVGGEPCGPPFPNPCPVPIDGGVGFLIAAGVVYGGKKFKDLKSKKA